MPLHVVKSGMQPSQPPLNEEELTAKLASYLLSETQWKQWGGKAPLGIR